MFSNPKANCCPRRSINSNEPCTSNPSYRRMPKGIKNPLMGHAMNNPDILSTVRTIDQAIQGPNCPNSMYDCSMTQQKKNSGHPLYQKWYMKTSNTKNYPVHYTIPPVDYRTYLQRQNEQMCSEHGNDFEKNCYMTSRDLEKIRCYQEFHNRNRKNKPSGVCPQCKAKKSMKSLPHCCGCRCAQYQKLGWQNTNPAHKQGNHDLEERRSSHLKCLTMKKSSMCHTNSSEEKFWPKKCQSKAFKCEDDSYVDVDFESDHEDEPQCPCGPKNPKSYCKGPQTEYQASYQYHSWDHSCACLKSKKVESQTRRSQPVAQSSSQRRRPWNGSIKSEEGKYEPSLAAAEAKVEVLEKLLYEKPKVVPDYLRIEQQRKFSNLRKEHPREVIRSSLLKDSWGDERDEEAIDGNEDNDE